MSADLLRVLTCGSVDDGKSSLLGRLLYETRSIFEDQLTALERDTRRYGTQGERLDLALLVDGLQAEREQGITIDVAYRFFSTARRRFIVADTPGHEQYTRNMATGASTAELAIILVDARKGLLTQTRRHTRIVAMMGIRHVVLAVNKMDLVGYAQPVFEGIAREYVDWAAQCGLTEVVALPLSALEGDGVAERSPHMPWFKGPSLLEHLETVDVSAPADTGPLRLPVQMVLRPDADFRGFAGRLAAGAVHVGDRLRVMPSGVEAVVRALPAFGGGRAEAATGESVLVQLDREVDVSRGDVLAAADAPTGVADQFEARVLWMGHADLVAGRSYLFKLHTREARATVTAIRHRVDLNTGAALSARQLSLNDIGVVTLSVSQPVPFEPYGTNRTLGGGVLIDPVTFDTVGAVLIDFALRRSGNMHWHPSPITRDERRVLMQQRACCIWFTGLSGSGKSTIAHALEQRLHAEGRFTYVLDGDNIRHGLNRDLGFTEAARVENIRRVAEVARLMVDAGLVVIVAFISPFRADRDMARDLFGDGEFLEVFVDTPLEECERRDPKGLYRKARAGELPNFTGLDSPYEPPASPEVRLDTARQSVDACVDQVRAQLP